MASPRTTTFVLLLSLAGLVAGVVQLLPDASQSAEPRAPVAQSASSAALDPDTLEPPCLAEPVATASGTTKSRAQATELAPLDGFWVSGALVEPDGTRIASRDAEVVLVESAVAEHRVKPRADGSFVLGPLAAGSFRLAGREPDHASASVALELSGPYAHVHRDVVLEPWQRITVRVRNSQGEPLAREMMSSRAWGYAHCLYAAAYREAPAERGLAPGDTVASGLGEYQGIGRDAREPMRDSAQWDRETAPLDAIGELRLRSVPAHVALAVNDRLLASRRVSRGEREVEFELDLAELARAVAGLRLRVVDGRTGVPIAGAQIWLGPERDGQADNTGADGACERLGLAPGALEVHVRADGLATWSAETELLEGVVTDLGDVRLGPASRLHGRVLGLRGEGLAYGLELVALGASSARPPRRLQVSSKGDFAVSDLPSGAYLVRGAGAELERWGALFDGDAPEGPRSSRAALVPRQVELAEGEDLELDLQLVPAELLELRYDPAALDGARVTIEDGNGLVAAAWTLDADAPARIALPLGNHRVRWSVARGVEHSASVAIGAGENVLELR